jgi:mRNA (guanine-N7-)-methyltransferase
MDAKDHYDALDVPTKRARAAGPAAALKRAHNAFKEELIREFATGAGFLVDIGCGRGGDIAKWDRVGVRNALGLDVSDAQIDEANRRARESGLPAYSFEACSASLDELDDIPDGCVDVVATMFSLNYFFGSEESAATIFGKIARILRPGGTLVGVYVDGDEIEKLSKSGQKISESGSYELETTWDSNESVGDGFGKAYKLLVRDTVMDGTAFGGSAPVEHVARASEILRLAASVGLKPVRAGFGKPSAKNVRDAGYRKVVSLTRSFAFEKSCP